MEGWDLVSPSPLAILNCLEILREGKSLMGPLPVHERVT